MVRLRWEWWRVGWLEQRLPKGRWCFYEWRWDDPVNRRWVVIGKLAFKVG